MMTAARRSLPRSGPVFRPGFCTAFWISPNCGSYAFARDGKPADRPRTRTRSDSISVRSSRDRRSDAVRGFVPELGEDDRDVTRDRGVGAQRRWDGFWRVPRTV